MKRSHSNVSQAPPPAAAAADSPFRCLASVWEDARHPLYAVAFNPFFSRTEVRRVRRRIRLPGGAEGKAQVVDVEEEQEEQIECFATCGGNKATVYYVVSSGEVLPQYRFEDEDASESFYTCAFSFDPETKCPWLLLAGEKGIIRVIDCVAHTAVMALAGHGDQINEIRVHPTDPWVVVSVSTDESVRVWNLTAQPPRTIFLFGGDGGHRNNVLSVDFDQLGTLIASSGMDHSVKVWRITEAMQRSIEETRRRVARTSAELRPVVQQFPIFSTQKVHGNYVDCVRWVGTNLLSKAPGNHITLWKMDLQKVEFSGIDDVQVLNEFAFKECPLWFIRFGLDPQKRLLAFGNDDGSILLWDVDCVPSQRFATLITAKCTRTIRQLAWSSDSSTLVAVCDDGKVFVWQRRSSE